MINKKIKFIDLFAGCGGLADGFLQSGLYEEVAAVEWLKPQVETLRNRLITKWNDNNARKKVIHFDIQRETELFQGCEKSDYEEMCGLDKLVKDSNGIDIVIGGPPCQAYSVAGRVRDNNGMKNDYRNYLFEHYLNVVDRYKPKLFVFENVPGILSAMPDGSPIINHIKKGFANIGYTIIDDIAKFAKVDASEYGVPQVRKRIIIIGIKINIKVNHQKILQKFYSEILPRFKTKKVISVKDAIGNLPSITPSLNVNAHTKKDVYTIPQCNLSWHSSRYHSVRDMEIFKMLAEDLESGKCELQDSKTISKIYEEKVGSKSPIHRYHVLNPHLPSTTIIAHLYKDGNRFIHYDSKQARSITVREAARLQSFDDDFEFIGSRSNAYQMIGNAVPPQLAKILAFSIYELYNIIYHE